MPVMKHINTRNIYFAYYKICNTDILCRRPFLPSIECVILKMVHLTCCYCCPFGLIRFDSWAMSDPVRVHDSNRIDLMHCDICVTVAGGYGK